MKLRTVAVLLFCIATAVTSHAQTFTSLSSLSDNTGASPQALGQQANGKLWVATSTQGKFKCGTVFQASLVGELSEIRNFSCTDGNEPQGLTLGTDGNYYGVTYFGGSGNGGTVFKLTPTGTLTVLHHFTDNGSTGSGPVGVLALGTDGNFYGATFGGGEPVFGYGTLFRITPSGTLTTLIQFDFTNGAQPDVSPTLGRDGNFYGTTSAGGTYGGGTVYRITPQGKLKTIYNFGAAGAPTYPTFAPLIQGRDGNFYSTTGQSGANNYGTVYKVTPSGTLTVLHNFDNTDGYFPGALMQATDGNFYGTTAGIDNEDTGSIFQMTPAGDIKTLHTFDGTDGINPVMLIQDTNGVLYGVTAGGGDVSCVYDPSYGCGTIFSLDVGLGPFVETQPTSGPEGAKVGILGQGFTSSSVVKFGGVQAETVTATGTTFLRATVPAGALTGSVTVTTGSTKLTSNLTFRATPQVKSFTPLDGPEGTVVTITGTGLMQTRAVTFDGVEAAHTVESDTEVKATVPAGAKTGKIAITTLGGTATSAAGFTIE
jgi:uncharacterized repeat protein (TIGR03803 family)